MTTHLKLNNVHFAYDKDDVIKGVSLEIREGEIVGILGPNGAGKSTLIKLMGGILPARSGEIILGGRPMPHVAARDRARDLALVPQESRIPFSFSAMEVVLMGRTPHLPIFGFESARDVDIARDAMARTDCLKFTSRDIHALSGGERQRVILARALAQEPKVLLLDEPTAFLDIRHQIELHQILVELNRERGLTVISAMHDVNLAAGFCRRIVILKDGRIVADGAPAEVVTPSIIRDVFGASVFVGRSEKTKTPYCIPFD